VGQIPRVTFRGLVYLGLTASLAGCGATSIGPEAPPSFVDAPLSTVTSSSGQLQIGLRWSPAPAVKGQDAVQLTFLDNQGLPVKGLAADVVPWMPAHGHGTSVQPTTTSTGPGVLVASPVYLFMSGEWQIRMTISGALEDSAIAVVQIP
jgi:hypothetical protein